MGANQPDIKQQLEQNLKHLKELEEERDHLAGSQHQGFRDAVRMTRLVSEIEALDAEMLKERERIADESHER